MNKKKSKTITYCPIFFNIQGKRCVVVGGGKVALRKVKMLLDCGANVTVISPTLRPEMLRWLKEKKIHLIRRDYAAGDLRDAVIAIAGTNSKGINRKVSDEAKKIGALANVVDDSERSDFIIPSFFRRGNLTVAVSSSGRSPAYSRKIKMKLEQDLGKEYGLLLSFIIEVRSIIKGKGIHVSPEAWQEALDLDSLINLLRAARSAEVKSVLLKRLESSHEEG